MHSTSKRFTRSIGAGTALLAVLLALLPVPAGAQEAGEPVELALPAPMGSLKVVPSNQDLFDILANPFAASPNPNFQLHQLTVNPLTAQPMRIYPDTGEIDWNIPVLVTSIPPFDPTAPLTPGPGFPPLFWDVTAQTYSRTLELPRNETDFIIDRQKAIILGKALFWDMQVGSDGIQSCGSCHFNAGVDNRTKNQLNPNTLAVTPDNTLQVKGPNLHVTPGDFPFHKLLDPSVPGEPLLNAFNVIADANDVMSSMGVRFRTFDDIPTPGLAAFVPGSNPPALLPDLGTANADPVGATFQNLRRVEPRNTPTMHGAAFNFDNFWDGRARHDFNGGSISGAADPQSHVFVNDGSPTGPVQAVREIIRLSSLASQAVGPPLSNFEMSFDGRNWQKIGKKLLQSGVTPLANQLVAVDDSVLGPYSNQNITPGMPGLSISYAQLIEEAFGAEYWASTAEHMVGTADVLDPFDNYSVAIAAGAADPANTSEFSQKESNFSLFFALAIQTYEQTLIPDNTPFDQFMDANPNEFLGLGFVTDIAPGTPGMQVVGLTERQLHGFDLFQGSNHSLKNPTFKSARCGQCHNGPEMTDHSIAANSALLLPDPLTGRPKVIVGVHLEEEIGENAQDAVEIDNISFGLASDGLTPTFGQDITGLPTGHSLLDNGIYNIGVRPINDDISRGADDLFGFPLSLASLALMNAGLPVGTAVGADPTTTWTFLSAAEMAFNQATQIWEPTGITLPAGIDLTFTPHLPAYYAEWANDFTVGEAWPMIDETVFLPNTVDQTISLGLFPSGTYPNANRVGRMGNFKAPSLRNVALTGPYFHTGSYLTLRQVVDFYARGGDFPASNTLHRDPHILSLGNNFFSQLTEAEKDALVDFLTALTDERVAMEQAPFDKPEIFVPEDGTAPDNIGGRAALLANSGIGGLFRQVAGTGATGRLSPVSGFMGVSSQQEPVGQNDVLDHFDTITVDPAFPGALPPSAVNDAGSTQQGKFTLITVTDNDTDPDNALNLSSVAIATQPLSGLAWSLGNGVVLYLAPAVFTGADSFTYTVRDVSGLISNAATVTVAVSAASPPGVVIDAPTAAAVLVGNTVIEATATESAGIGIQRVEFYASAVLLGSDTSFPYAQALDTTLYANGPLTLSAKVVDDLGNSATANVNVTIDNVLGGTLTLNPVADARVQQANASNNYGASFLRTDGGSGVLVTTLLQFQIAGMGQPPTSAKLRLYATSGTVNGPAVRKCGNFWTEMGVNWNNQPAATGAASDDLGAIAAGGYVEWEVTSLVQGNGTLSLCLTQPATDGVDFQSREQTNKPQLVIDFAGVPLAVPGVAITSPAPAASLSGTVNITATATDTNFVGIDRVEFYAGSTLIGTDTSLPYSQLLNTVTLVNGATVLTAVVYDTLLNSASANIPVTIANAGGTLTFNPSADARVEQSNPSSNFGGSALRTDGGSTVTHTNLKFLVAGIAGTVSSAKVRLYATSATVDGPVIQACSNTWTEGAVTWSTRPSTTSAVTDDRGAISAGGYVEWDVTSLITGNATFSFRLSQTSSDGVDFLSRESASNKPQLVVTYGP